MDDFPVENRYFVDSTHLFWKPPKTKEGTLVGCLVSDRR